MIEPRLKLINGWEQDAIHCRRIYCYTVNRPRNVRLAKQAINKRERRYARKVIERELD
jgi:hypothetical protein